jgi:DNA gyrase subunit A
MPTHAEKEIKEYLPDVYTEYAMSVITDRAIPDVRDGLKPVQRRILYSMWNQRLTHDKPHKKSARTVGEVLGKYHPHGDRAVYDALVRMGQTFTMRHPLVDGQGNFGSIDGDPAAAMRYTEARLTELAEEFFDRLEPEGSGVDWQKNFDGSTEEPEVLPVPFPNLLVNGTSGIAVGMSTDIPPHNLKEVLEASKHLLGLENPEQATWGKLLDFVKGPDYPTGGVVFAEEDEIEEIYRTGQGSFELAGKVHIENVSPKREAVVIEELPYHTTKSKLIDEMVDLAKSDDDPGISTVRDESDRQGLRVVVECRLNRSGNVVLNNLYENTPLKSRQRVALLALKDGVPRDDLDLKEILISFNEFMDEVLIRNTRKELELAEDRLHIVRGLIKALIDIERVVEIVTQSENSQKASEALQHEFEMTEEQTEAVLDRRIRTLTNMKQIEIEQEKEQLLEDIEEYEALLENPDGRNEKRVEKIQGWYTEIIEKYGEERDHEERAHEHTEIQHEELEIDLEDLRESEPATVSLYPGGYIRRDHGSKGLDELDVPPEHFVRTETLTEWIALDDRGTAYSFLVSDLPKDSRDERGVPFQQVNSNMDDIVSCFPASVPEAYVLTSNGYVKRMAISDNDDLSDIRPSGIKYTELKEDDTRVVDVLPGREDADIVVVAENGKGLRFETEELKQLSRNARGVIAKRGDSPIAGGAMVKSGETLLLQGNSTCAAIRVDDIELQGRGGKGRYLVKPGNGDVLHTVLVSSSSPKASKEDSLERFTSKSKLGGHGAREEIDHFVVDITENGEAMELFE